MHKQSTIIFLAVMLALSVSCSFTRSDNATLDGIQWYTWEEAMAANEKEPRKIVVDVYTDWCYWCKVMDKKTFSKRKVTEYVNSHFYPVKLNAEQKEEIMHQGQTFKYVSSGKRGYHELAASLLDGKLSFPSIVYLSEDLERIMISPGFKEEKAFIEELKYAKEEHYKTGSFKAYSRGR